MTRAPRPAQRILVVEDERLWSRVLQRRLTAAGYLVDCAANDAAALARLRTAAALPDLILTDLFMPIAGGYEYLVKPLPVEKILDTVGAALAAEDL